MGYMRKSPSNFFNEKFISVKAEENLVITIISR